MASSSGLRLLQRRKATLRCEPHKCVRHRSRVARSQEERPNPSDCPVQHSDIPFVFHRDGVTVRAWKTCWNRACTQANLKGRYLHDCRRTAARDLVRAGVSERIAMALLGHEPRCMFDRYNIVSERDLRHAGDQLTVPAAPSGTIVSARLPRHFLRTSLFITA